MVSNLFKLTGLDIWGDSVNVASRMSTTAPPDKIQVSQETFSYLKDIFKFEKRGEVNIKGKGMMTTYYLLEQNEIKSINIEQNEAIATSASSEKIE